MYVCMYLYMLSERTSSFAFERCAFGMQVCMHVSIYVFMCDLCVCMHIFGDRMYGTQYDVCMCACIRTEYMCTYHI
jgi:hypothetical protein